MNSISTMNDSRERIRREREREKNTYTSPRLALRRVLLLAEGRQFREAATVLSRLGPGVLQAVATELPIDLLVEALPHSAHLLETLLNRLISLEVLPRPDVQCEQIAWRLVGLLGGEQGANLKARTSRLASALASYNPASREVVDTRRRQLDAAVQGLGTHGLTADGSGALISLHVAMKNELQRHVETYKQALHKIEEFSPVTINQDPASSSHQRLLALTHGDVERRLIDNKSLLTIIDKPALKQLQTLVAALAARVESDKAVLASVGQIKRSDPTLDTSDARPIAGVLMSYSRGCAAVLEQMSETERPATTDARERQQDSASDGYHSDSDDSHPHTDRSKLVAVYAGVWALAADETLPALRALEPLRGTAHLHYKIVFSIAVLSFRAAISLRERRINEVKALLGADTEPNTDPAVSRLQAAAMRVLQQTAHSFPLGEAERTVVNQVLTTLREYPCLTSCAALHALVAAACRAAWTISLHSPPLRIDTDFTPVVMDPDRHVRLSTSGASERRSDLIKSFVWPALMDGSRCVFRAVVLT
ncbi:mitochondria-eating protein domain-containing protein [Phthorimaea operculella]|nr:mitochondria-eating protein domain-containing protein [Phthorimaea operculella]